MTSAMAQPLSRGEGWSAALPGAGMSIMRRAMTTTAQIGLGAGASGVVNFRYMIWQKSEVGSMGNRPVQGRRISLAGREMGMIGGLLWRCRAWACFADGREGISPQSLKRGVAVSSASASEFLDGVADQFDLVEI